MTFLQKNTAYSEIWLMAANALAGGLPSSDVFLYPGCRKLLPLRVHRLHCLPHMCLTACAAAGLPVWVLPFEVLVTSAGTALIQLIPDSTSVHSIKARSAAAASAAAAATSSSAATASPRVTSATAGAAAGSSSSGVSLSEHFFAKWRRGSPECLAAQRRFVESLAAYSLITYLLQVRARETNRSSSGCSSLC
jgi:hypothetical protein